MDKENQDYEIEIIPSETVEMVLDFYNHITPLQAKEIGDNYSNKQPEFFQLLSEIIHLHKLKQEQYNDLFYMMCVTLRSFEYYNVEFHKFSLEELGKITKSWVAKHFKNNLSVDKRIDKMKKTIRQKELVDFFDHVILGTDQFNRQISKKDYPIVMSQLCMFVEILDTEILKVLGHDIS